MLDEWLEQVCVKIKYKDVDGSGVLFSLGDEDAYCITAWHCLKRDEQIDPTKFIMEREIQSNLNLFAFQYVDVLILKEMDIAIVKIKSDEKITKRLMTKCLKEDDRVRVVGYPIGMAQNQTQRFSLPSMVNSIKTNGIIDVQSEPVLFSYQNKAKQLTSRDSGAGIFIYEQNNDFAYLGGIITRLTAEDGAFNSISGYVIDKLNEQLQIYSWCPLDAYENSSFKNYSAKTKIFSSPMDRISQIEKKNIYKNVTPKKIKEHCKDKLVWPYGEPNVNDEILWSGWLIYLIFRCIEDENNIQNDKFYYIDGNQGKRNVKLIYVTNNDRLDLFMKDYILNARNELIQDRDIVIVRTRETPDTLRLTPKRLKSIVTDICKPTDYEDEEDDDKMMIDHTWLNANGVSVIHLYRIITKVNDFICENEIDDLEDENEIINKIKGKIHEVLYED